MGNITMNLEEELQQTRKAKKFNLWLGIIGMFMMFAALSSGFIVYTASGVDKGIKTILPQAFIYSTLTIVLSSITLHFAYSAAKLGNIGRQKLLLLVTVVLGIIFFVVQVQAWKVLTEQGVYFINNNASQSFIYVFTGLHLLHIVVGILVLLRALTGVLKGIPQGDNVFRMDLATVFWHFLDLLWIYIYVFLLLNQ
ncbi:cytochrome c oxidase subunit 3 [Sphingobacterium faecale]|uniref:Cytochrome c oxidase subunit 3 n=1 Tax=Sphingobacterium faecale TaxID=2803775 RepID=A0ABS1RAN6_9SPHI|nr:cytochrome c oxidase subunit 3 [Sphingobacterium faecale]MBL1410891.1 cytochrome c oxidase subunit 3 [Sphingobacterium faecale]